MKSLPKSDLPQINKNPTMNSGRSCLLICIIKRIKFLGKEFSLL